MRTVVGKAIRQPGCSFQVVVGAVESDVHVAAALRLNG
jgi:hypothetical protein